METWVFLRGLVREQGHWSGFLEAFAAAFPDRRVVAIDLPGNGAHHREASPLRIEAMVASARAEFLAEKGERNYLFAVSLGAMVGLSWMHQFPEDFAGATLVNTSLRGLSPVYRRLRPANYGRILAVMRSRDLRFRERTILELTTRTPGQVARHLDAWEALQRRRPVSVRNALRQLLAAIRFAPPKVKPRPPLLILNSAQDTLVHPSCSERLARAWGCALRVNERAGHDLTLDDPAWVLEQLRAPQFPLP